MISFACKKFDLDEVIRCSLGLTKIEYKILMYFVKNSQKEITTLQISKIFGIGLSTTQKAVKKIREKGLSNRSQKNLSMGGYVFVYSVKNKLVLKKKVLEIISNWVRKVNNEIREW